MSLLSVLKIVGKDLGHAGAWIDEGLQVAGPIIGVFEPQLIPIITAVEAALSAITTAEDYPILTADAVHKVVTAVVAVESIKASQTKHA